MSTKSRGKRKIKNLYITTLERLARREKGNISDLKRKKQTPYIKSLLKNSKRILNDYEEQLSNLTQY